MLRYMGFVACLVSCDEWKARVEGVGIDDARRCDAMSQRGICGCLWNVLVVRRRGDQPSSLSCMCACFGAYVDYAVRLG
jgi:hypothetical protein